MRDGQLEAAMDMVVQEFDKLAMCKRGTLETERTERRVALEATLKLKKSHDFAAAGNLSSNHQQSFFTSASIDKYNELLDELVKHPKEDAVRESNEANSARRDVLKQEMTARLAYLEDELKKIKMSFITGSTKMSEFSNKLARFESEEF